MKQFRVWMPDNQDESAGKTYKTEHAREAVVAFAEREHGEEPFDDLVVNCRRIDGDVKRKAYEYHLDVEVEVHINAFMAGAVADEDTEIAEVAL